MDYYFKNIDLSDRSENSKFMKIQSKIEAPPLNGKLMSYWFMMWNPETKSLQEFVEEVPTAADDVVLNDDGSLKMAKIT